MFDGKVQLLVYGKASDNSESPGARLNPDVETISIDMNAFSEILEPILLGMDPKFPAENLQSYW